MVCRVDDGGGELRSGALLAGPHIWRHHAQDAVGTAVFLRRVGWAEAGASGADVAAADSAGAGASITTALATSRHQPRVAHGVGVTAGDPAGGRLHHAV